jgi:hypothetical protein
MAKTKKEEVVESTTEKVVEETTKKDQPKDDAPKIDLSKFKSKDDDSVIKVDLSKPPETKDKVEEEQPEESTEKVVEESVVEEVKEKTEDKPEEAKEEIKEDVPVIEEITSEEEEIEEIKEEVVKAVEEAETTGKPLPESVEKLMQFMEETGGDLQDYVRLNQDIGKLDDDSVLREYYNQTKPHLTNEEVNFLMEDSFSYDEEVDEERDIKRKKLALKEQVASARAYLDGQKSKYYEEIKAGSKLTQEQQKAVDFFNRYNKESEEAQKTYEKQNSTFLNKTKQVFNENFKGFEYNVGDKKYRFNVKDVETVQTQQSDINNFVKKFLNKDNVIEDAKGYHKSIFTASNADAIAQHFYEQGKADALKESVAKSKNVQMAPRQSHNEVETGGVKYRVLGENSNDFKFKIKNKK